MGTCVEEATLLCSFLTAPATGLTFEKILFFKSIRYFGKDS